MLSVARAIKKQQQYLQVYFVSVFSEGDVYNIV